VTDLVVPDMAPCDYLGVYLGEHGVTQKAFAGAIELTEKHLSAFMAGGVRVTPDVALRLEAALSVPAATWGAMDVQHRVRALLADSGARSRYRRITRAAANLMAMGGHQQPGSGQ
jgi:plasmid maintenance system antidote protein VapI